MLISIIYFSCALFLFSFYKLFKFDKYKHGFLISIIIVIVISLLLRFLSIKYLFVYQTGDNRACVLGATSITKGDFIYYSHYYGIFPHAANCSIFYYKLTSIFGNIDNLIQYAFLPFSALELLMVVFIFKKHFSKKVAIISGILYALYPSLILSGVFSNSEPFYSFFIISVFYFFDQIIFTKDDSRFLHLFLCAFSLSAANFFRPFQPIILLSLLISLALANKFSLKSKVIIIAVFLSALSIFNFFFSNTNYHTVLYKKPNTPFGWNLFIGLNQGTAGHWNKQDRILLSELESVKVDPSEIQNYFFRLSLERLKNSDILSLLNLFKNKFSVWFDQQYLQSVVATNGANSFIVVIINVINSIIITTSVVTLWLGFFKKNIFQTIRVYSILFIVMFLLVEVGDRYKGGFYSIFLILFIYGILQIKTRKFLKNEKPTG